MTLEDGTVHNSDFLGKPYVETFCLSFSRTDLNNTTRTSTKCSALCPLQGIALRNHERIRKASCEFHRINCSQDLTVFESCHMWPGLARAFPQVLKTASTPNHEAARPVLEEPVVPTKEQREEPYQLVLGGEPII